MTWHYLLFWWTFLTLVFRMTLAPLSSISFFKNILMYWVPNFIFFYCKPLFILNMQSSPWLWWVIHRKNKKLTSFVSQASIPRMPHSNNFLDFSKETLFWIHVCTVIESQYLACSQFLGLSKGTFFAILSIFHMANCSWIRAIHPTSVGISNLCVETFLFKSKIFLPSWGCWIS